MAPHSHLPHLASQLQQPIVFLTVCTHRRDRILACDAVHEVLKPIWRESRLRYGWAVGRYVIMPDHVHLFARSAHDARALGDWMRLWKSLSSRRIRAFVAGDTPVWQRDYFDRFLRSGDSYGEKWSYVCDNPIRARLVTRAADWPYAGVIEDLTF